MLLNNFTLKLYFIPLWLAVEVYRRQGCKSLFEVGGAILGEGGYFVILGGIVEYLAHPDKFLEEQWPGYTPGICPPMREGYFNFQKYGYKGYLNTKDLNF